MKNELLRFYRYFPLVTAAVALAVSISITIVNVFTRYCLGFTFTGYDEIVAIGFAYTVFLGAAAAYRVKMHFGIDAVVKLFSATVQRVVEIAANLILAFISAYLCFLAFKLMNGAWEKLMAASRIPYGFFDLAAVIGFAFMTIDSVSFIFNSSKKGGEQE